MNAQQNSGQNQELLLLNSKLERELNESMAKERSSEGRLIFAENEIQRLNKICSHYQQESLQRSDEK